MASQKDKWLYRSATAVFVIAVVMAWHKGYLDRFLPERTTISPAPEGYDHDRWGTKPIDIRRGFTAFVVSVGGKDGDSDHADQVFSGQPQWVAYQMNRYAGELQEGPPPAWITDDKLHARHIVPDVDSYRHSDFDRARVLGDARLELVEEDGLPPLGLMTYLRLRRRD